MFLNNRYRQSLMYVPNFKYPRIASFSLTVIAKYSKKAFSHFEINGKREREIRHGCKLKDMKKKKRKKKQATYF